jgi:hypothetical protein
VDIVNTKQIRRISNESQAYNYFFNSFHSSRKLFSSDRPAND